MRRVVVVGAGLAGLSATQRLRESGFDGDVVVVGDETHRPYNRPPLSKQVLAGEQGIDECVFNGDGVQATWVLGNAAVALDPGRQRIRLTDGDLPYDGLVIATGRRARPWPRHLPPMRGFHTLRGIDDTLALKAAVQPTSRVVIVGGGFIGCEVAATLRRLGVGDITIVEPAPYLLPMLGPLVGAFAATLHRDNGIRVECGSMVKAFHGSDFVESVELDNGGRLAADIVLLALGSLPNTEWLDDGMGLRLPDGTIGCDRYCFVTPHHNIVAAGDVATWTHIGLQHPVRVEHWTNAGEMARAAVDNLLAGPADATPFVPLPTFWSDQYDVKIKAAGFTALADNYRVVMHDVSTRSLIVEALAGDRLVGAIVCNQPKAYLKYHRQLTPLFTTSGDILSTTALASGAHGNSV